MIGFCPPWIKNCGVRAVLLVPEKPLKVARDEPVVVDLGAPVGEVEPQIGVEDNCPTKVEPTDEPTQIELILPAGFWDRGGGGKRCGTFAAVLGSLDIEYEDGTFSGYYSAVGVQLAPAARR